MKKPADDTVPTPVDDDSWAMPRPDWSLTETRPIPLKSDQLIKKKRVRAGCLSPVVAILLLIAIYLFLPMRTTVLLLGTDDREPGGFLGRTDTMVLFTTEPWSGKSAMMSIPRDLWVNIPGYGENRINAAHYFAELDNPGDGPRVAILTVEESFRLNVDYYVRFRFDTVVNVIDALGGITLELDQPMSIYDTGTHVLDGTKALAFVRDRASGGDDFTRMEHGQVFVKALLMQLLKPGTWLRLPQVYESLQAGIETNVPAWIMPRIGFGILRSGVDGIESVVIGRDYVDAWTTDAGAMVQTPIWELIWPLVDEYFE